MRTEIVNFVQPLGHSELHPPKYGKRGKYTDGIMPPKLCPKCNRVWQFKLLSHEPRMRPRNAEILEDFPRIGCVSVVCPHCARGGEITSEIKDGDNNESNQQKQHG